MDRLPFGASCSPFVAIHTVLGFGLVVELGGQNCLMTNCTRHCYQENILSPSQGFARFHVNLKHVGTDILLTYVRQRKLREAVETLHASGEIPTFME